MPWRSCRASRKPNWKVVKRREQRQWHPASCRRDPRPSGAGLGGVPGKGSGVSFVPCDDARLEDTVQAIYEDLAAMALTTPCNPLHHQRQPGRGEEPQCRPAQSPSGRWRGGHGAGRRVRQRRRQYARPHTSVRGRFSHLHRKQLPAFGLRNGSLGRIVGALPVSEPDDPCCRCMFEGGEYPLDSTQVQTLSHSQHHGAQESGEPSTRVIVPIRKSRLLDQTLIYTAVTRGVDQVVLCVRDLMLRTPPSKPQPPPLVGM